MSINTFGHLFRVTTWGESHGEAIGATIDGCPPGIEITQNYIQHFMEKRRPGQVNTLHNDVRWIWWKFYLVFLRTKVQERQSNSW